MSRFCQTVTISCRIKHSCSYLDVGFDCTCQPHFVTCPQLLLLVLDVFGCPFPFTTACISDVVDIISQLAQQYLACFGKFPHVGPLNFHFIFSICSFQTPKCAGVDIAANKFQQVILILVQLFKLTLLGESWMTIYQILLILYH